MVSSAIEGQVEHICLRQGAESSEGQRRVGPLVEDGGLVRKAEGERGETLEVAEQDLSFLGVQEQGAGLIMSSQL